MKTIFDANKKGEEILHGFYIALRKRLPGRKTPPPLQPVKGVVTSAENAGAPLAKSEKIQTDLEKPLIFFPNDDRLKR